MKLSPEARQAVALSLDLPLQVKGDYLVSVNSIEHVDVAIQSAVEATYICDAINYHDRMAAAIGRLLQAEHRLRLDPNLRPGATYSEAVAERMAAFEELAAIHKELNP